MSFHQFSLSRTEPVIMVSGNGRKAKGKKIMVKTVLNADIDVVWDKLLNIDVLYFINKPRLSFKSISPNSGKWAEKETANFKLFAYGFIPLGKHSIFLEKIDRKNKQIQSRESGTLIEKWDHSISIKKFSETETEYTDVVEIYAGILTGIVAWGALLQYKHRHKRWQLVLSQTKV